MHSDMAACECNKSKHTFAACLLTAEKQQKMVVLSFFFFKCHDFLVKVIENKVLAKRKFNPDSADVARTTERKDCY